MLARGLTCALLLVTTACAALPTVPVDTGRTEQATRDIIMLYSARNPVLTANPDMGHEPVFSAPATGSISSGFGMRKLAGEPGARMHNGIDIRLNRGTPVMASAKGTVTFAGSRGAYGKMVELEHAGGMKTRYAHLDRISVKSGQEIALGAILGTVGNSGRTTGYCLHFEILVAGKAIDPLLYLPLQDDRTLLAAKPLPDVKG